MKQIEIDSLCVEVKDMKERYEGSETSFTENI